jgi:uncharacterized membrane-anchored protein
MKNKSTIIGLFILVVFIQLAIPFKMILNEENVLSKGTPYKFLVRPVDPKDPFRGKYISLRYAQTLYFIKDSTKNYYSNERIYILLENDKDGFMQIKDVSKEEPTNTQDYVEAKVSSFYNNEINIDFPFDRYYMDEFKAYEAEKVYNNSLGDVQNSTYALVYVKDGRAVIKDVLIKGVSIKEVVENNK